MTALQWASGGPSGRRGLWLAAVCLSFASSRRGEIRGAFIQYYSSAYLAGSSPVTSRYWIALGSWMGLDWIILLLPATDHHARCISPFLQATLTSVPLLHQTDPGECTSYCIYLLHRHIHVHVPELKHRLISTPSPYISNNGSSVHTPVTSIIIIV